MITTFILRSMLALVAPAGGLSGTAPRPGAVRRDTILVRLHTNITVLLP